MESPLEANLVRRMAVMLAWGALVDRSLGRAGVGISAGWVLLFLIAFPFSGMKEKRGTEVIGNWSVFVFVRCVHYDIK